MSLNSANSSPRTVLHIDMDAFFTSIEQRDNPSLKGQPVIVGAHPGHRGVVSAASYEARKYGVHSAMPISEAFKRCPKGIFLPPRMGIYSEESRRVMDILQGFSPMIEQVSVDEAFLDITGTQRLFGSGLETAKEMQKRIWDGVHLTASIGIAHNKFLAKFASDLHKPNGITEVPFDRDKVISWLAPFPAGKIWGVGKKTEAKLLAMGIVSIGDIQKKSSDFLVDKFGSSGSDLYRLCRGLDDRQVEERGEARSISRENTFEKDTSDREQWKSTLLALAQDVARQARRSGCEGRTVVLAYRGQDFTKHSRRKTLASPTCLANQIFSAALDLTESLPRGTKLRLIGVGITGLDREMQLDLFTEERKDASWEKSERAVDKLLEKFGDGAVVRGTDLC